MATMDSIFSRGIPIFSISLPWTVKKDSITIPPRHPLPDITGTSQDRPKSVPYPRLKNSKTTSKCQFTVLENWKTKKMDRVARRGPLARASGALKGGHFRNCQHFCRSWRGNLLKKKQIFEKKSHNAEKLKGGPLRFLSTQSAVKYQRNWRGNPLEKKFLERSLTMPKNWKGDPSGFFNIHSIAKHQKIEGRKFLFSEKNLTVPKKNWKGGTLWDFQHPFCRKTAKKLKGGSFGGKFFPKQKSQCRKTSRDRPKSSPYPRLKNSKKTSKCQEFF